MNVYAPNKMTVLIAVCAAFVIAACSGTAVPATPAAKPIKEEPLQLAAIGDSISVSPAVNCEGCTDFVSRYATALSEAAGRPVNITNLSTRMLQIDQLLTNVDYNEVTQQALTNADVIIVSIAFNDVAWLRNDDPCDGINVQMQMPDWSKYNADCAAAAAEQYRPKFEDLFSKVVALRSGAPTLLLTINRYNDWIGWTGADVTPEAIEATRIFLDAWNAMVCEAAQLNGFHCADIYHLFNGEDGLSASGENLTIDYTHLSDIGHTAVAEALIAFGYDPIFP